MAVNTTKMNYWNGTSYTALNSVSYWSGSVWNAANLIWRWDSVNWLVRYSTPTVTCADITGSNSGNAASGLVTSTAAAPSLGGHSSGNISYFWQFVSGDAGIAVSSFTSPNAQFSKIESTNSSAVWKLNVIDNSSGATNSCNVNVTLTWTNTILALHVAGANPSGSYTQASGAISGVTVTSGTGGAIGGCTPSGGNGSYTFAWTYVSGDAAIACTGSTTQHPTWSKSMSAAGGTTTTATAVWQISLNDTNSDGPVTTTVTITLSAISNSAFNAIQVTGSNAAGSIDAGTIEGNFTTTVSTTTGGSSVTGGNGSYVYNWTYISGNGGIGINNSALQNPTWSSLMTVNNTNAPLVISSVWQVSVSDTAGNGPVTTTINVQLTLTADHAYPTLSVTGANAGGLYEIGFARGTVCENVSNSSAGSTQFTQGGAFPSGGSGIYTYTWSYVSGDNLITINNSALQNPTWTRNTLCSNGSSPPNTTSAIWQVSVTDSAGFGPVTAQITITLTMTVDND